jgi:uncharacterized protein (TIGR02145 family)
MRIKNNFSLVIYLVLSFMTIGLISCKETSDPATTPELTTLQASLVGQKWAGLNAAIKAYNQTLTVTFEYGTSSTYGLNISGTPPTLSGNTTTAISALLTDLTPATKYHFRIKATSATETFYGVDSAFTTTNPTMSTIAFNPDLTYGSVNDIDNNIYKTITIGTQTWMAENLKTTKYNDGTPIAFLPAESFWNVEDTAGYCWYNNDSIVYGGIYNWQAVNSNKLCPVGWHVPSDDEWTVLTTYLGGAETGGSKLMEAGVGHWATPNTSLTNETGFTALPGGYRNYYGDFGNIKLYGYWWASTESSASYAYCRLIYYSFNNIGRTNTNKKSGLSVRCLLD